MTIEEGSSNDAALSLRHGSASTLLARLDDVLEGERVSIGAVIDALGPSGLGITILLLALPSFLPIPGVPTGFVFGTALAALSVQVLIGARQLMLPRFVRRFSMPRGPVVRSGAAIAPWFERIERLLEPRLEILAGRRAQLLLALPIFIHAVMILLPIPLGNQLPALAVIAFAFGFIERDGFAVIAGMVLSVVAVAWNTAILLFGAELGKMAYRWASEMPGLF